jgi:hypothetical protein
MEAASVSSGFRAVIAELEAASGLFQRESRVLSSAVTGGGPHPPDGGDGVINAALTDALRVTALTTGQFAAVVGSYGQKLRAACDEYETADDTSAARAVRITGLLR